MLRALTLLFCLFLLRSPAHADGRTDFRLEARGGMITHQSNRLDANVTRFRLLPEVVHRSKKGLLFHFSPTVGVAKASLSFRRRVKRSIATERFKSRITEATENSPRTLNVPTSGFGVSSGLLPPTIAFPIGPPGDPGADIPDTLQLDLPFAADLDVPWTPVLGFRTSIELLPDTRFRFEPFVDYEHSIVAFSGRVRSISLDAGGFGFDMGFLRHNIAVTDRMSFLTAGFRLGYMAHRWRPYIDLGIVSVRNVYDISAQGTLKDSLAASDVNHRERGSDRLTLPFTTVGIEIDATESIFLRTEVAVLPTNSTSTIYLNGGAGFRLGR